jgi:hypothetical protein
MAPDMLSSCAITGTTGYIGGYLSPYLQDRGMHIRELTGSRSGKFCCVWHLPRASRFTFFLSLPLLCSLVCKPSRGWV